MQRIEEEKIEYVSHTKKKKKKTRKKKEEYNKNNVVNF